MSIPTTQTFLQKLSLRLSDELGDVVVNYTADGNTIKSIQRESSLNRAVELLYESKLKECFAERKTEEMGIAADLFMTKWLEYRYIKTYRTPPATDTFNKESKMRYIMNVRVRSDDPYIRDAIAYPLKPEQYHQSIVNPYSNFKPSLSNPKIFEYTATFKLELGGSTMKSGRLSALCLIQPVYTVFSITGDDILAPVKWEDEIIELAKAIVLGTHQQ